MEGRIFVLRVLIMIWVDKSEEFVTQAQHKNLRQYKTEQ